MHKIRVWDLPVRLFHWLLVIAVAMSFYTMKTEGAPFVFPMRIHAQAGFVTLGLLVFRWAWGLVGSHHARFWNFLYPPRTILGYLRGLLPGRQHAHYAGHNPLGGLASLTLLLSLSVQVGSGLFISDDIFFTAPLYSYVSSDTSSFLRTVHAWNSQLLLILIGLHLVALIVHRLKGEKLVAAMVTGHKRLAEAADEKHAHAIQRRANPWVALPLIVFAIGVVAWLW